MTTHTPGPWRIGRGAQADPFAIEAEARTVAHVKHAGRDQTEANARLIAAAPEMLDALYDLVLQADDTGCSDDLIVTSARAIETARALLDRIDGTEVRA